MRCMNTPRDPAEAERRFAELLEHAGLPRFTYSWHDRDAHEFQLVWEEQKVIVCVDLMCDD